MNLHDMGLEMNLASANFADRYETAFAAMKAACDHMPQAYAAGIRAQINAVHDLVDTIWGEGTYAGLKLDEDDLMPHLELVEAIVAEATTQSARIRDRYAKYRPNRAERRAGGKK